jgi:hypothetical protein
MAESWAEGIRDMAKKHQLYLLRRLYVVAQTGVKAAYIILYYENLK